MTRVLRSATKKIQAKKDLSSKPNICKNSKTIKSNDKKAKEIKNQGSQKNDIWNIGSILSSIFSYTDRKDLVKFNTVCKKWNYLTNHIIHKNIKVNRSWKVMKQVHDPRFSKAAKIDAEVLECISNNAKHAQLVKKFNFIEKLKPQRAIEFFETFRFINILTIDRITMSQDQFLGMINPLAQLQELTLKQINIKKIIRKRLYTEVVQLPSSLKRLRIEYISLANNPELFVQTINSHSNLVEYSHLSHLNNGFLEPFCKPYPSLKTFEYNHHQLQNSQSLFKIVENNTQLTGLKLALSCWNNELSSRISNYLTNLEEFRFSETIGYNRDFSDLLLKFSQPTKIRKLSLGWLRMSNCSLNSILQNCPHLEELELNRYHNYQLPISGTFINLSKSFKVKKLAINCDNMSGAAFSSLILSFPDLNELSIVLPIAWKEWMNVVYENCGNLQKLDICTPTRVYGEQREAFLQEIYQSDFFTCISKCKSTLTNLTLKHFKAHKSKAENFKYFENLRSIKYPAQSKNNNYSANHEVKIDEDLWQEYKLISKDNKYDCDIEFRKIQT
jgi:hypothetical protein